MEFPSKYQCHPSQIEKTILKFIEAYKRPQIAKANMNKKKKAESTMLPDFKTCYEAKLTKIT
jgi:hypothetical protein